MVPSVAAGKIPGVTSPGIDPETFRIVAQCFNHYATPGPKVHGTYNIKIFLGGLEADKRLVTDKI
jgi:hypothetical protein